MGAFDRILDKIDDLTDDMDNEELDEVIAFLQAKKQ